MPLACICGHSKDAHDHYREGSDCGECGYSSCPYYAPRSWRGRIRSLLAGR